MGSAEEGWVAAVRGQEPGGGLGKYFGIRERRLRGLNWGNGTGAAEARAARVEAMIIEERMVAVM